MLDIRSLKSRRYAAREPMSTERSGVATGRTVGRGPVALRRQRLVIGAPGQRPGGGNRLCRRIVVRRDGGQTSRGKRTGVDHARKDGLPARLGRARGRSGPLRGTGTGVCRGNLERSEQRRQTQDERDQRRHQAACHRGHLEISMPHLGSSAPAWTGRADRPLLATDIFVTPRTCGPGRHRVSKASGSQSTLIGTFRNVFPVASAGGRCPARILT